jgi:hypothetical protein
MVDIGGFISQLSYNIPEYFLYSKGFWGLLGIIVLIVIYLVRPKPVQKVIPSLMFFLKQDKKTFANSFFKVFTRNLLFLIQLLPLILLPIAAALPYFNESYSLSVENNVMVIDVSASSQAKFEGKTRFDETIDIAKRSLGKRNTIVLASDIPELKMTDATKEEAKQILSRLKPKDTISNIAEAMSFAGEQVINNEGRILVISDFIFTGADPVSVKRLMESRGLVVDFVEISSKARNVGIIDLAVSETTSVLYVKNFNEEKETFTVKIGDQEKNMEILPGSIESLQFTTPPGTTEIELNIDDDFEVDNKAYVQNLGRKTIDVLMITNNEGSNLHHALTSSPRINLDITNPPLISGLNHEIYVIKAVDQSIFLKETVNDLEKEVREGANLIIAYQEGIFDIDWGKLMPVVFNGMENNGAQVKLDLINQFTKDTYFGRVPSYAKTTPKDGTTVIASTEDNSSIIAYTTVGRGKVIYYGIDDRRADFKGSTSYPIFWNNILKFMVGRENINNLNFRTGSIVDQQHYDKIGKYELKTKSIVVNLINEDESDINKRINEINEVRRNSGSALFESERPREYDHYFLIAAIAIIFFELIFIKVRGDL